MSTGLIVFLIILFVAAVGGTALAFMQEDRKIKKYEAEGDSVEDQLRRSHEYESSSLKSNIPLLVIIYTVTIVTSLIAFVIYII